MNPIVKNSLIATSVLFVVYAFNVIMPQNLLYSIAATLVLVLILGKFVFSIDFRWESARENFRFLVLPLLFNIGTLAYISFIYFDIAKVGLSIFALLVNFYLFVSLRRVKNLAEKASIFYRNVLIAASFATVFLTLSMFFRMYMVFSSSNLSGLVQLAVVIGVFALIYFVSYFLAWENGGVNSKFRVYNLVNAFLLSEIAWVSTIWVVNYPVIGTAERATLGGTPLPAISITIIFYFLWGLILHKIEKNLTSRVFTEYVVLTLLFMGVLLLTAKWLPN